MPATPQTIPADEHTANANNAATATAQPGKTLAATAMLLERLDRQPRAASADQYRLVVQRLGSLLQGVAPGAALEHLLSVFPGTAQVYENQHYGVAGLCRSPLEAGLNAELAAAAAIRHARRAG